MGDEENWILGNTYEECDLVCAREGLECSEDSNINSITDTNLHFLN